MNRFATLPGAPRRVAVDTDPGRVQPDHAMEPIGRLPGLELLARQLPAAARLLDRCSAAGDRDEHRRLAARRPANEVARNPDIDHRRIIAGGSRHGEIAGGQ